MLSHKRNQYLFNQNKKDYSIYEHQKEMYLNYIKKFAQNNPDLQQVINKKSRDIALLHLEIFFRYS